MQKIEVNIQRTFNWFHTHIAEILEKEIENCKEKR